MKEQKTNILKRIPFQKFWLVLFIALLWLVLSILSPYFFRMSNILLLLYQTATVMISGIGMTFVILTGGTDLSVGGIAALSGMYTGIALTRWGWESGFSILLGLCVGLIVGLVNGTLISRFKLQPMVCTLGTMSIARGLTLISTSGRSLFVINPTMYKIGNGEILGIPNCVVIALVIFVIGYTILTYTEIGRYIYAVGGNESATRLSGVNTEKIKTLAYTISGLCASVVGIILVCTLGASEPTVGDGLELDSIAVTAIGGTSLMGGQGSLVGTIFGAILIGTIKNGLSILNIVSYYQKLLLGIVIIVAVLLENLKDKQK